MTAAEDGTKICKCDIDPIEGALLINGKKVRYYKCPDCGSFTYHAGDLQKAVYRDAPSSGRKEERESDKPRGRVLGAARIATAIGVSIVLLVIIFCLPCNCLIKISLSLILGYYCGHTFVEGPDQL